MRTSIKVAALLMLIVFSLFASAFSNFWVTWISPVTLNIIPFEDNEPPVITNVRHKPLYPNTTDSIRFYADVTDNVGVTLVQLNYTENGGTTWHLRNMTAIENSTTYTTLLGPYTLEGQILGFYVVAYDSAGNIAYGSEIIPPVPEPPRISPIVISNETPVPLPNGRDVSYNTTDGGTEVIVNVTEIGMYDPLLSYNITYSLDGGLTWIVEQMAQIGEFIWKYWINATTNIIFRIIADDGSVESRIYWVIVGPWKYPVYLYFATNEDYFPVKGLDYDGDKNVSNNWMSYQSDPAKYKNDFRNNDIDHDGVHDVWSYAYMNPKTLDDGCLVIEYWIYYAFNRYPIIDEVIRVDHEHDFESVYLWIDLATGNIKKIACSQHMWVNHYIFDVSNPPPKINLGVESGGHGMVLLKDEDNDGNPDLNQFDYYSIVPGVSPQGIEEIFKPTFLNPFVINPDSFVAQLYPWVIYDPRIPSSELHLFDDTSILTNGLSLSVISGFIPHIVSEIPQYYGFLTDLLTTPCVLKTTFGAPLPLLSDYRLVFHVTAPLFRQEFQEPSKFWWKVSFGWWIMKKASILAIKLFVTRGLLSYFKEAARVGYIASHVAGHLTGNVLDIVFDPVQGSVLDSQGHILGYSDTYNDLPGGIVLATRNMTNNLYDLYLVMTNNTDDYIYKVEGIENCSYYNFTVFRINADENPLNFTATEIPIETNENHRFILNWTALEDDAFGVEVYVDQDGDGVFEHVFLSDSELTSEEFEQAMSYDISVMTTDTSKYIIGQDHTLPINVSVQNEGLYTESFNVTIYANTTLIQRLNILDLLPGNSMNITCIWNTTGFAKGNYTITINATTISGEMDTTDNSLTSWIIAAMVGDITGPDDWPDGKCDMRDIGAVARLFGVNHPDPRYNPNYDITYDLKIDMRDIGTVARHFGEIDP